MNKKSFHLKACLTILLIADITDGFSEETRVFEERIFAKLTEINFIEQEILNRLDKIENAREPRRTENARCPAYGRKELLVEELEQDGWEMVFRATSSNGQSVYNAWTTGTGTSSDKPKTMARSYSSHYRNSIVSNWAKIGVKYVKYAYYKNNQEVAYVIFNGVASDMNSWFDKSRILSSSYSDLTASSVYNYFSIAGHYTTGKAERRFLINKSYGGCDSDTGHMVISDTIPPPNGGCLWDHHPTFPQLLYSTINSVDVWNRRMFGRADFMAIFIKV